MQIQPSTLYVVGTPIGNLEDITLRAIHVLQAVDLIAAEDTRHTGKLLQHFQITTPQISYHQHNRSARLPDLLAKLHHGRTIALVTDAGMPCISDPGSELVAACAAAGLRVVPIPGVTAMVTGLAASGLPCDRFSFEGFLPTKAKAQQARLAELAPDPRTLIFYEAPHRLSSTLAALESVLGGDRPIAIARELTKLHEEVWRGTLAAAIAHYSEHEPKGEFTLVVAGAAPVSVPVAPETLKAALQELLQQGLSRSQASKQLAQTLNLPRRDLYQLSLSLPEPDRPMEPS
jgi:16S rRNA (cytidine1402-2'-O)-methyltransferase